MPASESTAGAAKGTTAKAAPRTRSTRSTAAKGTTAKTAAAKASTAKAPGGDAAVAPADALVDVPEAPAVRLPYRLLTGPDTREFCERVSAALAEGYILYGSPSVTFNGETVIAAQAVVLPYAPAPLPLTDPVAGFAPYGGAL